MAQAPPLGVSTRKMKMVTGKLMGKEFSPTFISRFATTLDAELDVWRDWSLKVEFFYVIVDTHFESWRVESKIIDNVVQIGIGIDSARISPCVS